MSISLFFIVSILLISMPNIGVKASDDVTTSTVTQNKPFENCIVGSIRIDTFKTDCRMTGNVSFSILKNDSSNCVFFLPSSIGRAWIKNVTRETASGLYECSYLEQNFQGRCYSYGINFPWDTYELVFIFGFETGFIVKKENITVGLAFGDRMLDMDWSLNLVHEYVARAPLSKRLTVSLGLADSQPCSIRK